MGLPKGTVRECLKHLSQAIDGAEAKSKQTRLAAYFGVSRDVMANWLAGNRHPVGENLIRMTFYLEFLGYKVAEIEAMRPEVRDVARLFAFGISSIPEIADMVGYKGGERSGIETTRLVLQGKHAVLRDKLPHFAAFAELHGAQLESLKRNAPNVLRTERPVASVQPREPTSPTVALRTARDAPAGHDAIIRALAGFVQAAVPLVDLVLSDEFTPEERQRVRDLVGNEGVSRLSNLFTRLSGEAARNALSRQ